MKLDPLSIGLDKIYILAELQILVLSNIKVMLTICIQYNFCIGWPFFEICGCTKFVKWVKSNRVVGVRLSADLQAWRRDVRTILVAI
jgi:hypothetical protein